MRSTTIQPPGFCGKSVQRAVTDLRTGAAALLLRQQCAGGGLLRDLQEQAPVPATRTLLTAGRARSASRISSAATWRLKPTMSTPAAATRNRSRTTSTSRSTRGHRQAVSVLGRGPSRISTLRCDRDDSHTGRSDYQGFANQFHEASEQSVDKGRSPIHWPASGSGSAAAQWFL